VFDRDRDILDVSDESNFCLDIIRGRDGGFHAEFTSRFGQGLPQRRHHRRRLPGILQVTIACLGPERAAWSAIMRPPSIRASVNRPIKKAMAAVRPVMTAGTLPV